MAKGQNLSKAAQKRRREISSAQGIYQRWEEKLTREAQTLTGRDRELIETAISNIQQRREALRGINVRKPSTITDEQKAYIGESKFYRASNQRSEWARGESLGRIILSGSNEGHRFFALTESLWAGSGHHQRYDALRRAFNRNKDVVAEYGRNINVYTMIGVIENVTGLSLADEYVKGGSDQIEFMRGVNQVIKNYG